MSQIITFYSYKGGVGRSMALANVATLLSKWGKKVLMIDWDLEAPGLENFFKDSLQKTDWTKQKGVLDFLYAQQDKKKVKWQDWVLSFKTEISTEPLNLLISGKRNGEYAEMLRAFNVSTFYKEHDGGKFIESFREELLETYDYVLIDSRTGVTDFGGICTIQMPDILVMLFTPTEQGLLGTKRTAERILEGHQNLPFDRFRLLICPVPSRFDSTTEFRESRAWLERSAKELESLYEEWVPADVKLNDFLQIIKIPYISYFSFGEKLPVIEQDVNDPAGLGYAYENLTMLLANELGEVDRFIEKREMYLKEAGGQVNENAENKHSGNLSRSIKIFISSAKKDSETRYDVIKKLESEFSQNNIEIIDQNVVPVGYSKHSGVLKHLQNVDIVLILITNNYLSFSGPTRIVSSPSNEVKDEFDAIDLSNKEIVIPIFIGINNRFYDYMPKLLRDRSGLVLSPNISSRNYNEIINNLSVLIEEITLRKNRNHIVV